MGGNFLFTSQMAASEIASALFTPKQTTLCSTIMALNANSYKLPYEVPD
jgi:hypothetical protein